MNEILEAIEMGHTDLESLKRFVGFGTGPCEGKQCIQFVRELLFEWGIDPGIGITARPPITPVPLALMSQEESDEEKL